MCLKKSFFLIITIIFIFISIFSIEAYGLQNNGYNNIIQELEFAKLQFQNGLGPKINNYTLDYKYFSPVKNNHNNIKYPVVIWIHGLGGNSKPGSQLDGCDIAAWGTSELQNRFKNTNGAFILVPRSPKKIGWDDTLINPLKETIYDFINQNQANIDINRIYIGGYSMGGWMALRTASYYPEMFASIFVACPSWGINIDMAKKIANIPIWIVSGKKDQAVNYDMTIKSTWKKILSQTNIPDKCRLSTLSKTCFPTGEPTSQEHMSWYSINYDLFSSTDKDYPNMSTIDGNKNSIKLIYPNGMISWLSKQESNYNQTFYQNKMIEIKPNALSILLNLIENIIIVFNN